MKKRFRLSAVQVFLVIALLAMPNLLLAQKKSADEHWDKGKKFLSENQWEQAIKEYTKGLALDPKNVNGYLARGAAFIFSKQFDRAIADFSRALELAPDSPEKSFTYLNRGLAYRQNGQFDQALADFNKAIEIKPDNPVAYYYQASALDLGGKPTEALAALKKFVKMCPENENTRGMIDNAKQRIRLLEEQGKAKGK